MDMLLVSQGADAIKYIQAGISTDHECFTYEEALEKAAKWHENYH